MDLHDIQTIVIVILENRSFDHVLGYLSLPSAGTTMPLEGLRDDPAWRGGHVNVANGNQYLIHKLSSSVQEIDDPPHEQKTIALQINTPPFPGSPDIMGGFVQSYVQANPHDPSLVMGYYAQDAVPIFDFFARNYVVCDHWFCSLPLGTQANRLMAMSGESRLIDNASVFLPEQDLVYDWLNAHGVSWCAYQWGDFFPFFSLMESWLPEIMTSLALSALGGRGRFRRYSKFKEHWLAMDPMPNVIFIEPEYTDGPHADPNDDHPPTGIAKGQAFLADIYSTLISNPARWANTMMLVTYDEHGGFFDHVRPLAMPTNVAGALFTTTGVRVPGFIVSPRVQAGGVFNGNLDHTSILQMLADRFNVNGDYSAAVGARQPRLDRIGNVFVGHPPLTMRAPAIPGAVLTAIQTAASAPPSTNETAAAGAAANAQAFRNVARKAAQDYPDLVGKPGWESLSPYDQQLGATPGA